jgi:hypothetical protein
VHKSKIKRDQQNKKKKFDELNEVKIKQDKIKNDQPINYSSSVANSVLFLEGLNYQISELMIRNLFSQYNGFR